jgi:hypothetical protein
MSVKPSPTPIVVNNNVYVLFCEKLGHPKNK